jgi:hypothetical protein
MLSLSRYALPTAIVACVFSHGQSAVAQAPTRARNPPRSPAPAAHASPGKVALDILALMEKSDVSAIAALHAETLMKFDHRAASLPQAVLQGIWDREFVTALKERLSRDPVGSALIDAPKATVIEVKSRVAESGRAATYDVYLQLEYASPERSFFSQGAFLKTAGLAMSFGPYSGPKNSLGIAWEGWRLVPEMNEPMTPADDLLVLCRMVPPGFSCLHTAPSTPREVYLDAGGLRSVSGDAKPYAFFGNAQPDSFPTGGGGLGELVAGGANLPPRPFRISMTSTSGQREVMQNSYAEPGLTTPYRIQAYAREPWFSAKWSGEPFALFRAVAKTYFFEQASQLIGDAIASVRGPTAEMVILTPEQIAAALPSIERAGGTTPPAGAAASDSAPWATGYPIASGRQVTTEVRVFNQGFARVQILLDGNPAPIELRGQTGHKFHLEIGSIHIVRCVSGGRATDVKFMVPRTMRTISVSSSGVTIPPESMTR